jgi:hypothetical protein
MYGTNSLIVENTRTVSRNLSDRTDCGSGSISSAVDVLIPEVLQVYLSVFSTVFLLLFFLKIKLPLSEELLFCVSVN